jgi:hypothetical protein
MGKQFEAGNLADEAEDQNAMDDDAASQKLDGAEGDDDPGKDDDSGEGDDNPGEGDDNPDDENNGYIKRINKITWQREQAKRELAAEKARAERLQAVVDQILAKTEEGNKEKSGHKKPPVKPDGKPRPQDFDNDEDFFDALTDWKLEQREEAARLKAEADAKKTEQESKQKAFNTRRDEVNSAGMKKFDDYEQVVFSLPGDVMTVQLAEAIFDTENAADVAYYLGSHAKEAEKISEMTPRKQAIALGKIDVKVGSDQGTVKKKSSNAPPPLKPVGGKSTKKINIDELSVDDYIRLRNEGKI